MKYEPPTDTPLEPIKTAAAGNELCYECDGDRYCWACRAKGVLSTGVRCGTCGGSGLCIVCNGAGELPLGSAAALK